MNSEGITIHIRKAASKSDVSKTTNLAQQIAAFQMKKYADKEKELGFNKSRRFTNGSIVQIHEKADRDKVDYNDLVNIAGFLAKES